MKVCAVCDKQITKPYGLRLRKRFALRSVKIDICLPCATRLVGFMEACHIKGQNRADRRRRIRAAARALAP